MLSKMLMFILLCLFAINASKGFLTMQLGGNLRMRRILRKSHSENISNSLKLLQVDSGLDPVVINNFRLPPSLSLQFAPVALQIDKYAVQKPLYPPFILAPEMNFLYTGDQPEMINVKPDINIIAELDDINYNLFAPKTNIIKKKIQNDPHYVYTDIKNNNLNKFPDLKSEDCIQSPSELKNLFQAILKKFNYKHQCNHLHKKLGNVVHLNTARGSKFDIADDDLTDNLGTIRYTKKKNSLVYP